MNESDIAFASRVGSVCIKCAQSTEGSVPFFLVLRKRGEWNKFEEKTVARCETKPNAPDSNKRNGNPKEATVFKINAQLKDKNTKHMQKPQNWSAKLKPNSLGSETKGIPSTE